MRQRLTAVVAAATKRAERKVKVRSTESSPDHASAQAWSATMLLGLEACTLLSEWPKFHHFAHAHSTASDRYSAFCQLSTFSLCNVFHHFHFPVHCSPERKHNHHLTLRANPPQARAESNRDCDHSQAKLISKGALAMKSMIGISAKQLKNSSS